jgi:hypothetical protein
MNRDTFIISVFVLVSEQLQKLITRDGLVRHGSPAPALSDAEVITIEICGEFFKLHTDKDIYEYFRAPYRHFFPALRDRSSFVRQAANLQQWKQALQQRLAQVSGAARDRCFPAEAGYGHCAAKKLNYYGFKLGLRIARNGMITPCPLLAARPHDINHLGALVEGFDGLAPADKGFLDEYQQNLWAERQGVQVVAPPRRNMKSTSELPSGLQRASRYWRKLMETVNSQLTERFAIARTRAHDLWHYQGRLIRKILAHTVVVFLNQTLNRPPLHFTDLVSE